MKTGFKGWSRGEPTSRQITAIEPSDEMIAQRPEAYLDDRVRAAMSSIWALDNVSQGLGKLEADLNNGAWEHRYASLLDLNELNCGYRLVETVKSVGHFGLNDLLF